MDENIVRERIEARGGIIYGRGVGGELFDFFEKKPEFILSAHPPRKEDEKKQFWEELEKNQGDFLLTQREVVGRKHAEKYFIQLRSFAPQIPIRANFYYFLASTNPNAISHPYADEYLVVPYLEDGEIEIPVNWQLQALQEKLNKSDDEWLEIIKNPLQDTGVDIIKELDEAVLDVWQGEISDVLEYFAEIETEDKAFSEPNIDYFLSRLAKYLPPLKKENGKFLENKKSCWVDKEYGPKIKNSIHSIGDDWEKLLFLEGFLIPVYNERRRKINVQLPHYLFSYALARTLKNPRPCKHAGSLQEFIEHFKLGN